MRHFFFALAVLLCQTVSAADPVILTLADFTGLNGGAPSEAWVTEPDGTIHLTQKGAGALISKAEYKNFELEWEWKIAPGGNNGIKYWVTKVGGKEWLGIEYQMIDDAVNPDGMKGGSHGTGAIYDIKDAAPDKVYKPAGEWNLSKIVVQDGKVQHWLNGKLTSEADTTSADWLERIAKSKFKTKPGFAPGQGKLMLTEHGAETWFRNLRVTAK
jgi:hypothetical protein